MVRYCYVRSVYWEMVAWVCCVLTQYKVPLCLFSGSVLTIWVHETLSCPGCGCHGYSAAETSLSPGLPKWVHMQELKGNQKRMKKKQQKVSPNLWFSLSLLHTRTHTRTAVNLIPVSRLNWLREVICRKPAFWTHWDSWRQTQPIYTHKRSHFSHPSFYSMSLCSLLNTNTA